MEFPGLSIITANPVLAVVLLMDAAMGLSIARNMLHPYLGNFDIALILTPLGDKINPPSNSKVNMAKLGEPAIMMMASRIEFNPMHEAFRVGKKNQAFTYKVDPNKLAFLQRTHRVFYYLKGKAYPVSVGYGVPAHSTTSKGMDIFVAQKLWGQAVAATQKMSFSLPIFVAVLCIVAGLAGGFTIFYAAHAQLGFVPAGTSQAVTTATTTGVLGKP